MAYAFTHKLFEAVCNPRKSKMILIRITWLAIMCIGILINPACAQVALVGHEWNVTLKVVDETGQPIEGAKASVGCYSKSQPKSIDGLDLH